MGIPIWQGLEKAWAWGSVALLSRDQWPTKTVVQSLEGGSAG